jgi:hypothetical protein
MEGAAGEDGGLPSAFRAIAIMPYFNKRNCLSAPSKRPGNARLEVIQGHHSADADRVAAGATIWPF